MTFSLLNVDTRIFFDGIIKLDGQMNVKQTRRRCGADSPAQRTPEAGRAAQSLCAIRVAAL